MHARKTPKENVFRYGVCFYLLDLDELPELDRRVRLFGWNRRNVVSLHDRDHMDMRAYLAEHGVEADRIAPDELARARLRVQPGQLLLLLPGRRARLHRRRGQQHLRRAAPLPPLTREPGHGERRLSYRHDKKLHVSPFFGLDQSYQWWFSEPGEQLDVRIDLSEGRARPFFATLTGKRRPLTTGRGTRAHPLSADAAAGHGPDPPPGRAALAEARAVLPQAAVRARRGIGEEVTEVLRELPAGRRIGAGLAERAAIRALDRIEHGALELRLPGGHVYRAGTGDPIAVTVTSNDVFRRLARSPASASASPTPQATGTPTTCPA